MAPELGRVVPLSPVQEWFFAQSPVTPASYTQSHLMRVPGTVSPLSLRAAVRRLAERHDALWLRFRCDSDQQWQQWIGTDPEIPVEHVAPPGGVSSYEAAVSAVCRRLRARINLTTGPIAAAALIDRPYGEDRDVAVVVHHLAVDAVSWTIIGEELRFLLGEHGAGDTELPAVTTSFADWCFLLRLDAAKWADEVTAWAALSGGRRASFAAVQMDGDPGEMAAVPMRRATKSLDADSTRALLEGAAAAGVRLDHVPACGARRSRRASAGHGNRSRGRGNPWPWRQCRRSRPDAHRGVADGYLTYRRQRGSAVNSR